MKEALLYDRLDDERVRCRLCAHRCLIRPEDRGICQVRKNEEGTLYSLVYGQVIAQAVSPIEKKPLYHFYPGSTAYSIATPGCNLRCTFCQNADISQMPRDWGLIEGRSVEPEMIVADAGRHGCKSIAYTYTEPTIYFEYAYDVARLAQEEGIANVWVTNGYMTPEMLEMVTPAGQPLLMDAANVDLKAFREAFYRQECGARLQPVLDNLKTIKSRGVWLEVTTLVIPGRNDSDEELRDIAGFIAGELGVDTPWHVSRFHPTYRLTDAPPTPVSTLRRAWQIGREAGLRYVYEGNVPGEGDDTLCPTCGEPAIRRSGFSVVENLARGGLCAYCGSPVDGVGL